MIWRDRRPTSGMSSSPTSNRRLITYLGIFQRTPSGGFECRSGSPTAQRTEGPAIGGVMHGGPPRRLSSPPLGVRPIDPETVGIDRVDADGKCCAGEQEWASIGGWGGGGHLPRGLCARALYRESERGALR